MAQGEAGIWEMVGWGPHAWQTCTSISTAHEGVPDQWTVCFFFWDASHNQNGKVHACTEPQRNKVRQRTKIHCPPSMYVGAKWVNLRRSGQSGWSLLAITHVGAKWVNLRRSGQSGWSLLAITHVRAKWVNLRRSGQSGWSLLAITHVRAKCVKLRMSHQSGWNLLTTPYYMYGNLRYMRVWLKPTGHHTCQSQMCETEDVTSVWFKPTDHPILYAQQPAICEGFLIPLQPNYFLV